MNKVAKYLQEHLNGEVLVGGRSEDPFSVDASILTLKPSMVVHPRVVNDIRKVARFSWQLAEKGHKMPINVRGGGSSLSGGAISRGIIVSMIPHFDKILEIDTKQKLLRLQPGVNFKLLEEVLHTHSLTLPVCPTSSAYSTVGGAIGNDSSGLNYVKYGPISEWLDKLEVVLSTGDVIQTGRISKRELNKKKGLATFEGDIYRGLDAIINDNLDLIRQNNNFGSIGYSLDKVKNKDGSFDLTPLFAGSEGTLGVIIEAIIRLKDYSPKKQLIMAGLTTLSDVINVVNLTQNLSPSAVELVDTKLFDLIEKQTGCKPHGGLFGGESEPEYMLLIEFDDESGHTRSKKAKKTKKVLDKFTNQFIATTDIDKQAGLWAIRESSALLVGSNTGGKVALPFIEDCSLPLDQLESFVSEAGKLLERHRLDGSMWGSIAVGNLRILPLIDLSKVTDRQKLVRVMDEYYRLVIKYGGVIATTGSIGRLKAPYVKLQVGDDMYKIYEDVKKVFDPMNVFSPGVKLGTTLKDLPDMLRGEYENLHFARYLPYI
jgi:FAD/FMN-containing dehydrogenase